MGWRLLACRSFTHGGNRLPAVSGHPGARFVKYLSAEETKRRASRYLYPSGYLSTRDLPFARRAPIGNTLPMEPRFSEMNKVHVTGGENEPYEG
jgi:hypothetical protein